MCLPFGATRSTRASLALLLTLTPPLASAGCSTPLVVPAATRAAPSPRGAEPAAVEREEVCVGSAVASAGDLGDTLYYRAALLPDGKLAVGYFAFFSEERPWGNNWLTWTLLPALAIDLVYSHGLLVAPGVQRLASGPADVEGFRIVYDLRPDGSLAVDHAMADDGAHRPVRLEASDVLALDRERPTLYSDVWSHQLGGRGVSSRADLAYVHCFDRDHIRPLPEAIADAYALEGRAPPAHVEALGGRVLGAEGTAEARAKAGRPPL